MFSVDQRELLLPVQPVAQRLALHERHDIVEQAVALARVVEAENVGVLQVGGDADLAEKAIGAERDRELRSEHLDGDLTLVLEIPGEVHGGHATFPHLAIERVPVAQSGRQLVEQSGHCTSR